MVRKIVGIAFAAAAAAAVLCFAGPARAQEVPPRAPLGTNVSGLDDWSTEFSFLDCFKMSRRWISGSRSTWDDQRPLDLDARGWVRSLRAGQIARTLMFWATGMRYPAGRYVVEYEGQGTLAYAGGATLVERAPGREVIQVDPARGGIGLFLTATTPSNYLRNIRVRMPVTAPAGEVFYPPFLDSIRNYRAIRFMNWMLGQNGNNYVQTTWADRPTLQDARWNVKGAPVEVMCALANRLGVDAWFTIPHQADDDYVRNFAQLALQLLDPRLKAYVEYSNEVWNGQFPQARYAQARGLALNLSANPYEAQIRFHGRRSREIFGIFEAVFPKARLVRVLGSHVANRWTSDTALAYGDVAAHTDALAIAPYFGVQTGTSQDQARVAAMSVDALFAELMNVSEPQTMDWVRQQLAVAQRYRLPLISYEGGQHLVGVNAAQNDPAINALFDQANRDARMGPLYTRYLTDWAAATGGGLFMHLTNCGGYGRYGRFGSLETLDQPRAQAPKFDALQRYLEESARLAPPANPPAVPPPAATPPAATPPAATPPATPPAVPPVAPPATTPPAVTPPVTNPPAATPAVRRVLLVLANLNFYYREYNEPRQELERAGFVVEVAAGTRTPCRPHGGSGQGADGGLVQPDVTIAQADPARYVAVVFVGGWGASSYQFAFPGTYTNTAYRGDAATKTAVNTLVNAMLSQNKFVTALCHGVTVLAWARVGNASPLAGKRVCGYAQGSPAATVNGRTYADNVLPSRWHVESNRATMVPSRSVGDATTAMDDVLVDGRIITAENYDSARQFGRVLAENLNR
ncbi:MAG: DJ-1/PfpI family protein [Planctomycetes bacterium]|nr:DJ-1/PfpI family protein [Planctomycetota bacterium]